MTIGLFAGPLQMLFSLLLMQGLSLTMFRTFLNQAIPRFDPLKFSMSVGNDQNRQSSTSTTPAPNFEAQNLLPYLNLLAPILLQQQMQRSPQNTFQQLGQQLQTNAQQSVQPSVMTAPAYLLPQPANNPQMPQVIIVPQVMPQSQATQPKTGSASTNFPVKVEAPNRGGKYPTIPPNPSNSPNVRINKRMLERPPKTTRQPMVDNRGHAGAMHVSFVTPRAPAGFRRFVIPPVTARMVVEPDLAQSTDTYDKDLMDLYDRSAYTSTQSTKTAINTESADNAGADASKSTTISVKENFVNSDNRMDNITSTTSSTQDVISSTTSDSDMDSTVDTTTAFDKNLLNNSMNGLNKTEKLMENNYSLNDLIHEDFVEHVKNLTNSSPIDSNQSSDTFFENSKETDDKTFKRVCIYLLSAKDGNLKISNIDPYICSHLIVGFASVAPNDLLVPQNPNEDPEKYHRLTNLKSINRKLKVMLSVGDGSGAAFSKMVSTDKSRDKFVASVLDFCDSFGFDGIDIDWEFPYFRTGSKEDKHNFILLLKEIRIEAIRRFRDDFIISATVGTPLVIAMASYDIPLIAEAVDFVNLMSYDFNQYRSDRPYTGHHSPLYPRPTEKGYFLTLNAAWSATYWANKGMPLHKIILGIPTFARSYNLVVPISQGLDVPVNGPGLRGGKMNYTAVCHFLSSGATKEFDVYSQVPFAYKNFDWIAYESEISAALKAQWVVKANMGGIMTFALNYDDIKGDCRKDGKKFPLQKSISNLLQLASIRAYRKVSHSPDLTINLRKV